MHKLIYINNLMTDDNPPEKVFIVPYRDREPHKLVFTRVMPYILGDSNYRILFVHQQDTRPFNRGLSIFSGLNVHLSSELAAEFPFKVQNVGWL